MVIVTGSFRELTKRIPGSISLYNALSSSISRLFRVLTRPLKFQKINSRVEALEEMMNRVEFSQIYRVNSSIHPEDLIYDFVISHPGYADNRRAAVEYYFSTGDESARKLISLKHEVGLTGKVELLEFASGYGCVTRHLVKYTEEFQITSCDIHKQAIDFIEKTINVPCIESSNLPEDFKAPKQYGIVFALSFFSHMPQKTWGRWLAALYRAVEPGGYLIFTTHGLVSHKKFINHALLDQQGFFFETNSEQSDLDSAEYGTAITTPGFVRQEITKLETATVSLFYEGYWWAHQDVWVVKKQVKCNS